MPVCCISLGTDALRLGSRTRPMHAGGVVRMRAVSASCAAATWHRPATRTGGMIATRKMLDKAQQR